jgi:hypothetical protein
MKPPISILDRRFRWTSSDRTDVAATFARIREQMGIPSAPSVRVVHFNHNNRNRPPKEKDQ